MDRDSNNSLPKFIVVTGGVISGIGKGITASSIALLLSCRGINVTTIKIDPYLNIDAGTMSPYEHGECFVLDDGGEVDLDLGNYERFLDINLTRDHNITTGKIYGSVITQERAGKYLGKTVQIIPHITNEIKDWIRNVSIKPVNKNNKNVPDVCVIEVGGTIGDLETGPFITSIQQMAAENNKQFCFVHVSMMINNGELKTKPTQHSVSVLRSLGIVPNILIMRTPTELDEPTKNKLELFCQIKKHHIISNIDVPNIYYVPQVFEEQNLCEKIGTLLDLEFSKKCDLTDYNNIFAHFGKNLPKYTIVIAGKYTGSVDTYLSLVRAIEHASFKLGINVHIEWISAEDLEISETDNYNKSINLLESCDGIIIPGGFGTRGINGKIFVAKYARIHNKPILGICLGMHVMVVELAQSIGINCNSTEFDHDTDEPIIYILPNQTNIKGGTMRLGSYSMEIASGSKLHQLYNNTFVFERHRHRYEFNNDYIQPLENIGVRFTGYNDSDNLVEAIELLSHPYYIGCQFHPEFRSKYNNSHPLFIGLLESAIAQKNLK